MDWLCWVAMGVTESLFAFLPTVTNFRRKEGNLMAERRQGWDGHDLNALEEILRGHYLSQIVCDHEAATDTAICACSLVNLGTYPTVGQAVQSWVDHLMAVIRGGHWTMEATLRRRGAVR